MNLLFRSIKPFAHPHIRYKAIALRYQFGRPSDYTVRYERSDFFIGKPILTQQLPRMLAQHRGRSGNLRWCSRKVYRTAQRFGRTCLGVRTKWTTILRACVCGCVSASPIV